MSGAAADRPLRIVLLGDAGSVHTRRWAGFFAGMGHEMHILTPDTNPITTADDPRVRVHTFRGWRGNPLRGAAFIAASRSLHRVLDELDPDVLHSQSVSRYGLAAWLSRFRPYAITAWGSDVLILPHSNWRRRGYTWLALRGAELVTGGSEHLVKAAIAAGARSERTRYIHIGVNTERFHPGPPPAELRSGLDLGDARIVLSPRVIAPLYRQDVVVDAFARLPQDTLLLMTRYLAREPDVEALVRRAASLGVAERLRIVPAVAEAEVPDLYRLADVVVSVPTSDGGPNTVVEALASGRPIVASDLPPNREWLTELDPECLVPVGDVDATAAALSAVLARSTAERSKLASRGLAAVEARADQRASMAEMEGLYRELAARRRRRR